MERKPARWSKYLGLICLVLAVSACAEGPVSQPDQTAHPSAASTVSTTPEVEVVVHSDPLWIQSTDTYKEIIDKAEIIVVGKVVDTGWTFNGVRNPEKVQEPVETYYGLTRIYEVNVDGYLKGDGPKSFYIFNSEGDAWGSTVEEVQQRVAEGDFQPIYPPLLPDTPYLMFLISFDAANIFPEIPKGVYYSKITSPWIFDISDPQKVELVNCWAPNPSVDFTLPLDQVVAYIQHPELIPPTPTPVPEPAEADAYPYPSP